MKESRLKKKYPIIYFKEVEVLFSNQFHYCYSLFHCLLKGLLLHGYSINLTNFNGSQDYCFVIYSEYEDHITFRKRCDPGSGTGIICDGIGVQKSNLKWNITYSNCSLWYHKDESMEENICTRRENENYKLWILLIWMNRCELWQMITIVETEQKITPRPSLWMNIRHLICLGVVHLTTQIIIM